ncbi:MAG: hypothetical protein ABDI20_01515, partial [Candidatus Bipolaricaulaceae bacterium]
ALIGRQYAEFDARVIAKDIEFLTGLTLEQIGELFLTLAAAHDQGEFDAVYEGLTAAASLARLFGDLAVTYDAPRVKAFIRETALAFRTRAAAWGLPKPRQREPQNEFLAAAAPYILDLCIGMLGSFLYDLSAPLLGIQAVTDDWKILVELGELRQDVEVIKGLALFWTNIHAIEKDLEQHQISRWQLGLSALWDLEAVETVATREQLAELIHAYRKALADVASDDHFARSTLLNQLVDCALYLKEVHMERSGWKLQGVFAQRAGTDPDLGYPAGIVMAKDRTLQRTPDGRYLFRYVDVAIVQLHRQDRVSSVDIPRIKEFVDTAWDCLDTTYWARTVTSQEATLPALEIVAVVFSGESESGAALAWQLADGLQAAFGCRSGAIILLTWEEEGVTQWDCIGASCSGFDPEVLRTLVAQLTPRTRVRPPAPREHRVVEPCPSGGGVLAWGEPGGRPLPMRYGG